VSDDETFIRAIVDAPGGDLPRLVYADWLDDRDDPRGPYLRVECAWGKSSRPDQPSRDSSELQKLAATLDPVWVARVSRPPAGVCCEHFTITDRGPLVTPDDLDRFERTARLRLPNDYQAFLLNVNGGDMPVARVPTPGNDAGLELSSLYALESTIGEQPTRTRGRLEGLEWFNEDARPLLPIGDGGSRDWLIVMDVTRRVPEVLLFEDDTENPLVTLADSFAQFLSIIEPHGHEE
jgi:uncharacterized protein (TIGR02996 family)